MSDTPNLLLPYLAAGQAQKHITVNESLQRLDALVQLVVASAATSAQPGSPSDGEIYVLPAGKTGSDWGAMADHALAYYRDGAWEEIAPREGWLAYAKDADQLLHYSGAAWELFAPGKALTLSASDRIVGRVSSGAGAAEEITFTDQAQLLCDDASFREMCATLGARHKLAASAVAVAHTGSTSETVLATIPIAAGAIGPNGRVHVRALFSFTNNANAKTIRVRLGGLSGTAFYGNNFPNFASARIDVDIFNRNNAAIQAAAPSIVASFGASTSALISGAINTAIAQDLVITGLLANAGDTVTLEYYAAELAHGA